MKKRSWLLLIGILLAELIISGVWLVRWNKPDVVCDTYTLLNPLLACNNTRTAAPGSFGALQTQLEDFIAQRKLAGSATDVSVYFRELQGGPVFDINGDEDFSPASLLKLPLAFAYFDLQDTEPDILTKQVLYQMPAGVPKVPDATTGGVGGLVAGRSYSVETLLESMLAHSDNLAYYSLLEYLQTVVPGGEQQILETLRELGIVTPQSLSDQVVSVHQYSSLFRQLYNVSYLDAGDSQKILTWLSESDYDDGIVAGVPQGTKVADKYGIREVGAVKQLHDCGIVYYPNNPYLLCIMTRGGDFTLLSQTIAAISKQVYDAVANTPAQ